MGKPQVDEISPMIIATLSRHDALGLGRGRRGLTESSITSSILRPMTLPAGSLLLAQLDADLGVR